MNLESTPLRDVFVVTPDAHTDARGAVFETYRQDSFKEAGIEFVPRQLHTVYSKEINTVRGLNFQWEPKMAKLARVSSGEAFLVAVDIRKGSPTLGKWFGITATAENKKGLYAPAGFARGIQTLAPDTTVEYASDVEHNGAARESAILWNDPEVGIAWPIQEAPQRTKDAPTLSVWLSTPESDSFTY